MTGKQRIFLALGIALVMLVVWFGVPAFESLRNLRP
jgi:hypothetical protein